MNIHLAQTAKEAVTLAYKPYDYKKKKDNPEQDLNNLIKASDSRATMVARNKSARAVGKAFEAMLIRSCEAYEKLERATVKKIPEERQVIGRTGGRKSQMICVNARKAHPDFMGSVAPTGRTIVFDAKHTSKDRLLCTALTPGQYYLLDKHQKCGAWCFIAASFSFRDFFLIPFEFWRNMKERVGRKYLLATDEAIQKYRLTFDRDPNDNNNAYVWFLGRPDDLTKVFRRPIEPLIDPETGEEIDPESMVMV